MKATVTDPRKQREANFLSSFFALSNISARVVEQREAPDFLLDFEGRQIGLEVTEIHVPTSPEKLPAQARESIISHVIVDARRAYEARGGEPLFVGVGIASSADLRHIDRRQTAEELASLVLSLAPSGDETVDWHAPLAGLSSPPCIAFLILRAQRPAHWWAPQGGWVASLTEQALQSRIDAKAEKLANYRAAAEEVWLLLAIEGVAPSQVFDISTTNHFSTICSPFDRTFLISVVSGQCTELCVAP